MECPCFSRLLNTMALFDQSHPLRYWFKLNHLTEIKVPILLNIVSFVANWINVLSSKWIPLNINLQILETIGFFCASMYLPHCIVISCSCACSLHKAIKEMFASFTDCCAILPVRQHLLIFSRILYVSLLSCFNILQIKHQEGFTFNLNSNIKNYILPNFDNFLRKQYGILLPKIYCNSLGLPTQINLIF